MDEGASADDAGFAGYLASLLASWEALVAPHPRARVVRGEGFFAARVPDHPVLDNGVLLDPAALPQVRAVFSEVDRYAVWSAHRRVAQALEAAGMVRDEATVAMRCALGDVLAPDDRPVAVVEEVDPAVVARVNGVAPELLVSVPGLRAYATADGASGLVLIAARADVNVSFVATLPEHRRRGLASAVLRHALAAARAAGAETAGLQATPMAAGLYAGTGFTPVGAWQEWVPPARPQAK